MGGAEGEREIGGDRRKRSAFGARNIWGPDVKERVGRMLSIQHKSPGAGHRAWWVGAGAWRSQGPASTLAPWLPLWPPQRCAVRQTSRSLLRRRLHVAMKSVFSSGTNKKKIPSGASTMCSCASMAVIQLSADLFCVSWANME
jgi:hypothetical protein